MTKKDYELIAKTINEAFTTWDRVPRDSMVAFFEDALAKDNPRFSPAMFRAACGSDAT